MENRFISETRCNIWLETVEKPAELDHYCYDWNLTWVSGFRNGDIRGLAKVEQFGDKSIERRGGNEALDQHEKRQRLRQ